jgi:hypothetical protein
MTTPPRRTTGTRTVRLTVRIGFEGTSVELCLIPTENDGSKTGLFVIQAMRCIQVEETKLDCLAVGL